MTEPAELSLSSATITLDGELARQQLTAEWDIRGIELGTLELDQRGTLRPSRQRIDSGDPLRGLPRMCTRTSADAMADVSLREPLGQGGMGIVWAAEQTPLRREVAVKGLRPDAPHLEATRQLLREARVTGALEHPNVVPVHAIGRDEDDRPLIVMKRIEGTSWQELLATHPAVGRSSRPGPIEPRASYSGLALADLQRHLEILVQVAKAIHFAHSKGVVHRDIKPENVMLGPFGEVYVVDWGIAVRTGEEVRLDLPLAREVDNITGTPGYMAPEMACGDGARIDERTDVYLLGAVLYEVLTGRPPHEAPTLLAMLTKAYASAPPELSPDLPESLGEICRTALMREPEERYQSAAAFAAAVVRFLKHRDSIVLSEEAGARLAELKERVARTAETPELQRRLYNLFNEVRFGFSNALRIWEGNTRARESLQEALELMIGFELAYGSAGSAAALVAELPIAMPELAARVAAKKRQEKETETELKRMQREADPTVSDRLRARLAVYMALGWALSYFTAAWLEATKRHRVDHLDLGLVHAVGLLVVLAAGRIARDKLFINASAVRTQITIVLIHGAYTAIWPLCGSLGVSFEATLGLFAFLAGGLWILAAATVDRRMVLLAIAWFGAGLAILWAPEWALVWTGTGGFLGHLSIAVARARTTSPREAMPLSQRMTASWERRVQKIRRPRG